MMHEFLALHREELIERCRAKVAKRASPKTELENGIPTFLSQLIQTLEAEASSEPAMGERISGASGGEGESLSIMGMSAAAHGYELLKRGFTIEQVVHEYGDLCQAITELALELNTEIEINEFKTLNRCLDNAIATAVMEFNHQRDYAVNVRQVQVLNERLGAFAHELRNLLNSATLSLRAIQTGAVAINGATGAILNRSLEGLRILIDRSLSDARGMAGLTINHRLFSLADFIEEAKQSADLEAQEKKCSLLVPPVDPQLAVAADRELLLAALGNLLQNAFKFTHPGTEIRLKAYGSGARILIDVEDHCGGLPMEFVETIFLPFTQVGKDRSGIGLGLAISRKSVEANNGVLSVRDLPGEGCVFTINLPSYSLEGTPLPA